MFHNTLEMISHPIRFLKRQTVKKEKTRLVLSFNGLTTPNSCLIGIWQMTLAVKTHISYHVFSYA